MTNIRQSATLPRFVDISQKIGLVKKIALYLKARVPDYMEVEDMIQIGMVGLMETSKNYDADVGVTFDEYAKRRIKVRFLMKSAGQAACQDWPSKTRGNTTRPRTF